MKNSKKNLVKEPTVVAILKVMVLTMVNDVKDSAFAVSRTSTLVTATGAIVAADYSARGARNVATRCDSVSDNVLAWTMKKYAKKVK